MKVKSIIFHILELVIVIGLVMSVKLYTDYNKLQEAKPPKATSLEEFCSMNPDFYQKTIDEAKNSDASFEVKGNKYIIIYDYSDNPNYTTEFVKGEKFQNFLDEYFQNSSEESSKKAKKISSITGIPHIQYIYRCMYNGEIIYEKVYES